MKSTWHAFAALVEATTVSLAAADAWGSTPTGPHGNHAGGKITKLREVM